MTTSASVKFRLLDGWTLRKVATALAREWLPPVLAKTGPKAPRWLLQPVVETPETGETPLWEAGISTEEYEKRLEHSDLSWIIRANVARGRGKGSVLARLSGEPDGDILMTVFPAAVPDSLFDKAQVQEYLDARGAEGIEGLFIGLITDAGFPLVSE